MDIVSFNRLYMLMSLTIHSKGRKESYVYDMYKAVRCFRSVRRLCSPVSVIFSHLRTTNEDYTYDQVTLRSQEPQCVRLPDASDMC